MGLHNKNLSWQKVKRIQLRHEVVMQGDREQVQRHEEWTWNHVKHQTRTHITLLRSFSHVAHVANDSILIWNTMWLWSLMLRLDSYVCVGCVSDDHRYYEIMLKITRLAFQTRQHVRLILYLCFSFSKSNYSSFISFISIILLIKLSCLNVLFTWIEPRWPNCKNNLCGMRILIGFDTLVNFLLYIIIEVYLKK